MGLDMHLYAAKYTSEYFGSEHYPETRSLAVNLGLPMSCNLASVRVTTEAAYWRKANQIHAWFVKNVQDDEDECREHHVSLDQLRELRYLCSRLLADRDDAKAEAELPPKIRFLLRRNRPRRILLGWSPGNGEPVDADP